ncbi:hypothetical protein NHG29_08895 [Aerococcaceae bacterium NML160702]|nr:hypothetical protein [Aerococcaceae bacterium NML171108]MCW6677039.1 hypothetical protein [Aerococcaceae bacterium NML180378]MCW6681132.1 hypothetical protein [Aerococcaceae bacterium NML130460]MCW6682995.1 hypothetical protein [Aerococcaceae bacterium NML160702]
MSRWTNKIYIINVLLTIIAFIIPIIQAYKISSGLANQFDVFSMEQIHLLSTIGTIISTIIGLVINLNVYQVIFTLFLVEIHARYRYFCQLIATIISSCITVFVPFSILQQTYWLIIIRDLVMGGCFVLTVGLLIKYISNDYESQHQFPKAAWSIMLFHFIVSMFGTYGATLL